MPSALVPHGARCVAMLIDCDKWKKANLCMFIEHCIVKGYNGNKEVIEGFMGCIQIQP